MFLKLSQNYRKTPIPESPTLFDKVEVWNLEQTSQTGGPKQTEIKQEI